MKESKFVKTKIFAGYAILIAVCVLSVGYVYRLSLIHISCWKSSLR